MTVSAGTAVALRAAASTRTERDRKRGLRRDDRRFTRVLLSRTAADERPLPPAGPNQ